MNENDQEQERMKEEAYLAQVLAETDRQIAQAEDQLARREAEMVSVQRDVFEDGARSGGSLSSADGFESLVELNQSMVALTNMAVTQDNLAKKVARLKALRPSPYFGRIDFLFEGEKNPEPLYIGPHSSFRRRHGRKSDHRLALTDRQRVLPFPAWRRVLRRACWTHQGKGYAQASVRNHRKSAPIFLRYRHDSERRHPQGAALAKHNATNARHCGNNPARSRSDHPQSRRGSSNDPGRCRQRKNRDCAASCCLSYVRRAGEQAWPRRTSSFSHQTAPSRATSQVSCQNWARIMCAR